MAFLALMDELVEAVSRIVAMEGGIAGKGLAAARWLADPGQDPAA
jgi:hypothetical protein